ncbi:MAG: GNAT family N-acetyltransferase [Pseudomonadota bacterium]
MTAVSPTLEVTAKSVDALTPSDIARWDELRSALPQGISPLFSPRFTLAVGRVRKDVRILMAQRGDRMEACLAIHARPFGFARPLGAPFDDVAGPLVAPDSTLTAETLIAEADLGSYKAQNAISPEGEAAADAGSAYVIDVRGQQGEAYLEARRKSYPKRFKNFRRLKNKLEREHGDVVFEWGRPDVADLDQLLRWKREQFLRDGLLDITSATHSRAILNEIASIAPEDPTEFGGFMTVLRCQGELIAGHFGVREGGHFHPWVSAYRPEFADCAPGMVLLKWIIRSMGDMGLETYHLASGHGHYKKYFATPSAAVAPLTAIAPGIRGTLHRVRHGVSNALAGSSETSPGARLIRRMDHIAVCEPKPVARTREFAYALMRRSHSSVTGGATA